MAISVVGFPLLSTVTIAMSIASVGSGLGRGNNWIRVVDAKSTVVFHLLELIHFPRFVHELFW